MKYIFRANTIGLPAEFYQWNENSGYSHFQTRPWGWKYEDANYRLKYHSNLGIFVLETEAEFGDWHQNPFIVLQVEEVEFLRVVCGYGRFDGPRAFEVYQEVRCRWQLACQQVFDWLFGARFIGHDIDGNLEWFAQSVHYACTQNPDPRDWHFSKPDWLRGLSKHLVVERAYAQLCDSLQQEGLPRLTRLQFTSIVSWLQVDSNGWLDEGWFK